ncbi:hypothetical protein MMC27_002452 [Xylographa pallens]|nr:hypothetical protein [Xylographa pallens]
MFGLGRWGKGEELEGRDEDEGEELMDLDEDFDLIDEREPSVPISKLRSAILWKEHKNSMVRSASRPTEQHLREISPTKSSTGSNTLEDAGTADPPVYDPRPQAVYEGPELPTGDDLLFRPSSKRLKTSYRSSNYIASALAARKTVDSLEGFSWKDLELEQEDLAETCEFSTLVDGADHEMLERPYDNLPDDDDETEDDASGGRDSVIPSNKEELPVEQEDGDSSSDTSIVLGNEDILAHKAFSHTKRPWVRPLFRGISFSQDFLVDMLADPEPEAELQTKRVAGSKGASQDSCNDFELTMMNEEFAHFADQAAFQIGAACGTETVPSNGKVSQASATHGASAA